MPEEKQQKVVFDITLASIIKVVLVLLAVWLLYLVRDVLIILLVVTIISIALEPYVKRLAEQGVPRGLSVIVLYLALLIAISVAIYFVMPPVVNQIRQLAFNLPYYSTKISHIDFGAATGTVGNILDQIASQFSTLTGSVFSAVFSIFGGLVSAITIFALTYYSLVEEEGIRRMVVSFAPVSGKEKILATINKVSQKMGHWLRGQLTLMLLVGLADGLALWILGFPYALTLGIFAGLIEVVPIIGPILAGTVAVIVALISGLVFWKILAIIVVFILVQQIENHILIPKIMQKAIGLSPVIVIIAILVGLKLLGIGGAVLAVPVAAIIQVLLDEYSHFGKLTA
jgi:predicted PurR-regulated permease PerM